MGALNKNPGMVQHSNTMQMSKLRAQAEEWGNSGMASSLPFYHRKIIPHGGKRIFIFHVAVYLTAWALHI